MKKKANPMTTSLLVRTLALVLFLCVFGTSLASTQRTYFITDYVGSPIAAIDNNGDEVWRQVYSPYGGEHRSGATDELSPVQFAGTRAEPKTGLSFMGARYYAPDTGRFLSIDPVGYNDKSSVFSFNRYAYANNNPVRNSDPLGMETEPDEDYGRGAAPWLVGTWVHSRWGEHVRGEFGLEVNNSWSGLFNGRPDAFDPRPTVQQIWELKPWTWETGPKRGLAETQLAKYLADAGPGWSLGDSNTLFPEGTYTITGTYYNGSELTVNFFPDAISGNSGLVFYKIVNQATIFERAGNQVRQTFGEGAKNGIAPVAPGGRLPPFPVIP